ncbi:MAG: hypothetical protein ACOYX1_16980 [Acidobacteriota bacterium]
MARFPALFLLSPALLAPWLQAQQSAPDPVPYRVEITLREPGAAASQTVRRYAILTGTKGKGSYRLNQRVPYPIGPIEPSQTRQHYQFADRAISIECGVSGAGASPLVSVSLTLEIMDLLSGEKRPEEGGPPLHTATTRIQAEVPVAPGARARVASIDDPVLPRRFEVEVLVQRAQ